MHTTIVRDQYTNVVSRFDSVQEMLRVVGEDRIWGVVASHSEHWISATFEQCIDRTLNGDTQGVAPALALIEAFGETPATPQVRTRPSIMGGRANVPAALTGHPLSMLRRERVKLESAPIRIVVSVGRSAALSAETVRRHGCAVLALAMRLAQERPIELIAYVDQSSRDGRNHYDIMPIPTAPLDIAQAAYILTDISFYRAVLIARNEMRKDYIKSCPWALDRTDWDYPNRLRNRLGLGPDDLIVPGLVSAHDSEFSQTIMTQWVEDMYRKFSVNPQEE